MWRMLVTFVGLSTAWRIDRHCCWARVAIAWPVLMRGKTDIAFTPREDSIRRINTYSPIIATTARAITHSILLTSLSVVSTINAGVTPSVAPTTALLRMAIDIILCCDRNVPRMLGRWLYTRSDAEGIEVFIHC